MKRATINPNHTILDQKRALNRTQLESEPDINMNKFSAAILVLPLFALACGSSPTNSAEGGDKTARAALALGDDGEPVQDEAVDSAEPSSLPLVAADAGAAPPAVEAPETAEAPEETEAPAPEPVVGDAGAPVPEEPASTCAEGETRCAGQNVDTCQAGEWVASTTCDFLCMDGGCRTCMPGTAFCDILNEETATYDYLVCDGTRQLRKFVISDERNACTPTDLPIDTSTLPVETNPPAWVRETTARLIREMAAATSGE